MKRLVFLSVFLAGNLIAIAPAFAARQLSTPGQLSDDASITDLVRHNRDVRSKK